MENALDTLACLAYGICISQISLNELHALLAQERVFATAEHGHVVTLCLQGFHHIAAEETAAASDQSFHERTPLLICFCAHTASMGRSILELWRLSTGKGLG